MGGLRGDLSRVSLAAVAHPTLLGNAFRAAVSLQALRLLWALLPGARSAEPLLLDRVLRVPLVSFSHEKDEKNKIQNSKNDENSEKNKNNHSGTNSGTNRGANRGVESDYISSDDEKTPTTTPTDKKREEGDGAQRRRALLFNRNIHQWAGLLGSYLPRVLSVCVRAAPVSVDLAEPGVLRDFIFSKIHDVADRC